MNAPPDVPLLQDSPIRPFFYRESLPPNVLSRDQLPVNLLRCREALFLLVVPNQKQVQPFAVAAKRNK